MEGEAPIEEELEYSIQGLNLGSHRATSLVSDLTTHMDSKPAEVRSPAKAPLVML